MIGTFWGTLGPCLAVALIVAGAWLYRRGLGDGKARAERKADKAVTATIERIEDAKDAASAGGAGWHDRLHATRPK